MVCGLTPIRWLAFLLNISNLKLKGQNIIFLRVEQVPDNRYKSLSSNNPHIL